MRHHEPEVGSLLTPPAAILPHFGEGADVPAGPARKTKAGLR